MLILAINQSHLSNKKGDEIMNEQEVLQVLAKVGAVITGSHIVYTSGKHGTAYVDKDRIYPHTRDTARLCHAIALEFCQSGVEAVVGPEKGAIFLSQSLN